MGSEMCIRDRVSGIQAAIDSDPDLVAAKVKVINDDGRLVFSAEAVSYTHLTLPTIYSV